MKNRVLFFLGEAVKLLICLLIVGLLFGFNIGNYQEYRLQASDLEASIRQLWPSAEIVSQSDLDGNQLYVFRTDADYRYIFFPEALFCERYALNQHSVIHSYWPFGEQETLQRSLQCFTGTYHVEISAEELKLTRIDRTRNLGGFLPVQIVVSLFVIACYVFSFRREYRLMEDRFNYRGV